MEISPFKVAKMTLGDHSAAGIKPKKSPLEQCVVSIRALKSSIPKGNYDLEVIDRYMTDRKWLDRHLKPEYQGLPVCFWNDIEKLYRRESCWARHSGFSREGAYLYEKLTQKWGFQIFSVNGISKS